MSIIRLKERLFQAVLFVMGESRTTPLVVKALSAISLTLDKLKRPISSGNITR